MKSARERAQDLASLLDWAPDDARRRVFVSAAEMIVTEALRDQRQICAEAVAAQTHGPEGGAALVAVMNARAPGE